MKIIYKAPKNRKNKYYSLAEIAEIIGKHPDATDYDLLAYGLKRTRVHQITIFVNE